MKEEHNEKRITKKDIIKFMCIAYVVFIYLIIFLKIAVIE
jgi:hypothetical protein